MKKLIIDCWDTVMNNERNPLRHLDLAAQHYIMQVLGWMWSMVFSLTFFSIYQFGLSWFVHLVLFGGAAMTVAVFKEAEKQADAQEVLPLSRGTACVWLLDKEA